MARRIFETSSTTWSVVSYIVIGALREVQRISESIRNLFYVLSKFVKTPDTFTNKRFCPLQIAVIKHIMARVF